MKFKLVNEDKKKSSTKKWSPEENDLNLMSKFENY